MCVIPEMPVVNLTNPSLLYICVYLGMYVFMYVLCPTRRSRNYTEICNEPSPGTHADSYARPRA